MLFNLFYVGSALFCFLVTELVGTITAFVPFAVAELNAEGSGGADAHHHTP